MSEIDKLYAFLDREPQYRRHLERLRLDERYGWLSRASARRAKVKMLREQAASRQAHRGTVDFGETPT